MSKPQWLGGKGVNEYNIIIWTSPLSHFISHMRLFIKYFWFLTDEGLQREYHSKPFSLSSKKRSWHARWCRLTVKLPTTSLYSRTSAGDWSMPPWSVGMWAAHKWHHKCDACAHAPTPCSFLHQATTNWSIHHLSQPPWTEDSKWQRPTEILTTRSLQGECLVSYLRFILVHVFALVLSSGNP